MDWGSSPAPSGPGAGEQRWRGVRVLIYPTRDGCMVALALRVGRGSNHSDRVVWRRLLALGDGAGFEQPGAVLRAVSDALADAADNLEDLP